MFLRGLIFAIALLSGACAAPEPGRQEAASPQSGPGLAESDSSAATSVTEGQTRFGLELYRKLGAKPGNIFLSPASISVALGMVYAGAQGETAAEMARALHYPAGGVHEEMAGLLRGLPVDREGRRLSIGNALWVQKSFPLKGGYAELLRLHYGSGARQVDFVEAPIEAIATVNRWAEDNSAGRIKTILRRSDINERTRLVLTNAVYFKADWLRQFSALQTRPRPFHPPDGSSVSVPMMRQRGPFRLLDAPAFQAVEMPYKGEEFSMLLFLPKEKDGLPAFENLLDGQALSGWIDALMSSAPADLELVVPTLELDTRASLVPALQALGMRRAFTDQAELRGMADAELFVSDVIHQTYLRVDEKGTEAAAVTAALVEIESMPRTFHADHPFFFVIRDNRTSTLLFVGRIEQPSRPTG